MALERWLLEIAEIHPNELDQTLLYILKNSDSAALTAVVASIATAFSHISREALLALLRSQDCIWLDRNRLINESGTPSRLAGLIPQLDARNEFYEEERKEADEFPHRLRHLEHAILDLQLGSFAPQVHGVLDQLRAEIPPVERQDEDDRIWRQALHRMDFRRYEITDKEDEVFLAPGSNTIAEEKQGYVRLNLKEPEPDLKEIVEQGAAQCLSINTGLGLLNWGLNSFFYEEDADYDPALWQERLGEARESYQGKQSCEEYDACRDGPGFVAAVCTRDHSQKTTCA